MSPVDLLVNLVTEIRGETVGRSASIVATTEESYWGNLESAIAVKDDFGIRELVSTGKVILLSDTQELLVIQLDTAAITRLTDSIRRVVDIRMDVWHACTEVNIRRKQLGIRPDGCATEIDVHAEETKAYKIFQPDLSPEEFLDEAVFAKVRILSGTGTGDAVWTRLKYLKLPTHARSADGLTKPN